jgi:non-canonical (house-cleaning) NTP pyrophosphatase
MASPSRSDSSNSGSNFLMDSRDITLSPDAHRLYSEDILISPRVITEVAGEHEQLGLSFYTACLHGDLELVKQILNKGLPQREIVSVINFQVNGWMPLDIAIFHKSEQVISFLYSLKSIWNNLRRIKTLGAKEFETHVSWYWNAINRLQVERLLSDDHHSPSPKADNPFIVIVTTNDEEKLRAVTFAIKEHLNHHALVLSYATDNGVFHGQPWGQQATFEGASTRINNVKHFLKNGDIKGSNGHANYIVSVENGVFGILTADKVYGQDTACVLIEKLGPDNEVMEREFAFSVTRTYPLDLVHDKKKEQVSNEEIGVAIKKYYESEKILHFSRYDQIKDTMLQVLSSFKYTPTKSHSVMMVHGH